jgi:hypothetical protein
MVSIADSVGRSRRGLAVQSGDVMRETCDQCDAPVIEIDHYGERLIGCIECNRWQGSKRAFIVEMSVEDFEALRGLKANGRQARSV